LDTDASKSGSSAGKSYAASLITSLDVLYNYSLTNKYAFRAKGTSLYFNKALSLAEIKATAFKSLTACNFSQVLSLRTAAVADNTTKLITKLSSITSIKDFDNAKYIINLSDSYSTADQTLFAVSNSAEASDLETTSEDIVSADFINNSIFYVSNDGGALKFTKVADELEVLELTPSGKKANDFKSIRIQIYINSKDGYIIIIIQLDNVSRRFQIDIHAEHINKYSAIYINQNVASASLDLQTSNEIFESHELGGTPKQENCSGHDNCASCEVLSSGSACTKCKVGFALGNDNDCIPTYVAEEDSFP
jgi:hypothetical protein